MAVVTFYVDFNGETKGPYTLLQLKSMWSSGVITGNMLFCRNGMKEWLPLEVISHELEGRSVTSSSPAQPASAYASQGGKISSRPKRKPRLPLWLTVSATAIGVLFILVLAVSKSSDPRGILVESHDFGERWPLTVPSGFIRAFDRKIPNPQFRSIVVIFETTDGKIYGLNGHALTVGYDDIHSITKRKVVDEDYVRYEDLSDLIKIGLDSVDYR